jgi:hypothetical protein
MRKSYGPGKGIFGTNDWGTPGEEHAATPMVAARNATQMFAYADPAYNPANAGVGGLGLVPNAYSTAYGMGQVVGLERLGVRYSYQGGGRAAKITGARKFLRDPAIDAGNFFAAKALPGNWSLPVSGSVAPYNPIVDGDRLGLGDAFRYGLGRDTQFAQGVGMRSESTLPPRDQAAARPTFGTSNRVRAPGDFLISEARREGDIAPLLQMGTMGELSPRMEGLGDLAGKRSRRLQKFAAAQNQAIQEAVARGDAQAAIAAATKTPWQPSPTAGQVAATIATPSEAEKVVQLIQRAVATPEQLQTMATPGRVVIQNEAPVAPPPPPQGPAPVPYAPSGPITALGTPAPVVTPGIPASQPTAPVPIPPSVASALSPPFAYSGGGGGGAGTVDASGGVPETDVPAAPVSFFQRTVMGVPMWMILAGGAAAIYLRRRRS